MIAQVVRSRPLGVVQAPQEMDTVDSPGHRSSLVSGLSMEHVLLVQRPALR